MTTTVTVVTGNLPAIVTIIDKNEKSSSRHTTVLSNSEKAEFTLSGNRTVKIVEKAAKV